ncbi:MAG TPA: hypothetical protein PKD72_04545, partial [Gemmatales bacterium]|nr:hypothetical protein [Gemmatales bacterium]
WVGPLWFFFVFLGSMLAVVALMMIWWITAFTIRRNPGLKLSYALPAMISSALVLLWVWRKELLQH